VSKLLAQWLSMLQVAFLDFVASVLRRDVCDRSCSSCTVDTDTGYSG